MRYVAKIHVLDVLDQVVVSGYVYDAEGPVTEGEAPVEFSFTTPGYGFTDPYEWLQIALYNALEQQLARLSRDKRDGRADGGTYTISETGDRSR